MHEVLSFLRQAKSLVKCDRITASLSPTGALMGSGIKLFFSYSHQDESLRDELEKHLSSLKREGILQTWHDRDISAGSDWTRQINQHLEQADIILLLISPDFLASDYCYGIELKRAMERHQQGEAEVVREIPLAGEDLDPARRAQRL